MFVCACLYVCLSVCLSVCLFLSIPSLVFIFCLLYLPGAPTGRSGEVTFKDVVESYAADKGVAFIPKASRFHEGKQIWMFGKSTCYLDRDVVFVYIADQTWRATALEEILKIS